MKFKRLIIVQIALVLCCASCSDFLNVIPDNVPTIKHAFANKVMAERYLTTCYSFLPFEGDIASDIAMIGGDEIWYDYNQMYTYFVYPAAWHLNMDALDVARGLQNSNLPKVNVWEGSLFTAIRECNTFLENIHSVYDLPTQQADQWAAEVKFLKAYYHFYLLRMYGPIPIIDKNLPITATPEEMRIYREPIDKCFEYIAQTMYEAANEGLTVKVTSDARDMGRITKSIALAMRAKVLVTAASPLFNGNTDYRGFKDSRGIQMFNSDVIDQKWIDATTACREAVEACKDAKRDLYLCKDNLLIGDDMRTQLSIRGAVAERWNDEMIWGGRSIGDIQYSLVFPRLIVSHSKNMYVRMCASVPLHVADQFYSSNGLPIEQDKEWDTKGWYATRFTNTAEATEADRINILSGERTALMNFHRENRFYANLGFDRSTFFGNGVTDETKQPIIYGRLGEIAGGTNTNKSNYTGYHIKKFTDYKVTIEADRAGMTMGNNHPWPILRLADLYLMLAEASNEAYGPSDEVYFYVNEVRKRAGLKGVEDTWASYAKNPSNATTKLGLKEIIRRERMNELAFEGQRFWDVRRWRTAETLYNQPIKGWNVSGESEQEYYIPRVLYNQTFTVRDYFWPIRDGAILVNPNLVQNWLW